MDKPILFQGAMVRAILEGTKNQTRRILDPGMLRVRLPYEVRGDLPAVVGEGLRARPGSHPARMNPQGAVSVLQPDGKHLGVKPGEFDFLCPYAEGTTRLVKGEWRIEPLGEQRLWVRETWARLDDPTATLLFGGPARLVYKQELETAGKALPANFSWKPSIHMRRDFSRLTLDVTEVRVQRLQDITEEDAAAEGVSFDGRWWLGAEHPVKGSPKVFSAARDAFASLWDSINIDRGSWASNPFVWAVTFKRVEQLEAGQKRAHG